MIPGERLSLWALERYDIISVYKWVNDPEIAKSAVNWYFPLGLEDVENWYSTISTNPTIKVFSVRLNTGELIGMIELTNIDFKNRKADVGIILGEKDYWSKGYGEEALRLLVRFAFEELGFKRLSLTVLEGNERARNLFSKLGFKEEGKLRAAYFSEGRFHDMIVMGLLSDEWK